MGNDNIGRRSVLAGIASLAALPMASPAMILKRDEAFRIVFFLVTPKGTGTGTFIVKNDNEMYMVTANHIAKFADASSHVVVSDYVGRSSTYPLTIFNQAAAWEHHRVADLSVLRVTPNQANQAVIIERFLPYDHVHTDHSPVSRDQELTSVGFPQGMGVSGTFSPLTFRSYAASSFITLKRFDTNTPSEFFIMENPSVAGYSGCPIFDLAYLVSGNLISTKDKTRCYGFMHGTISDDTGGKLAAVTPAFYLKDLLG